MGVGTDEMTGELCTRKRISKVRRAAVNPNSELVVLIELSGGYSPFTGALSARRGRFSATLILRKSPVHCWD